MGSTTLNPFTAAITGTYMASIATVLKKTTASSDTVTISATTAQGVLDFETLVIRAQSLTSTVSATLSIGVGTEFSDIGVGAASVTLASEYTVLIGGKTFEGARFQTSAETLVITVAGAATIAWEAYQAPSKIAG
jgi:hypothetical protein